MANKSFMLTTHITIIIPLFVNALVNVLLSHFLLVKRQKFKTTIWSPLFSPLAMLSLLYRCWNASYITNTGIKTAAEALTLGVVFNFPFLSAHGRRFAQALTIKS